MLLVDPWVVELRGAPLGSPFSEPAWVLVHLVLVEVMDALKLMSQKVIRLVVVELLAVLSVDVLALLESMWALSLVVVVVLQCLLQSTVVSRPCGKLSAYLQVLWAELSSQLFLLILDVLDHVVAVRHGHLVLLEVDVLTYLLWLEVLSEVSHVQGDSVVASVLPIERWLQDEQDALAQSTVGGCLPGGSIEVLLHEDCVPTIAGLCDVEDVLHEVVVVVVAIQQLAALELVVP